MKELQKWFYNFFQNQGCNPSLGEIVLADRPDLADFQCNGALSGAKILKKAPLKIAGELLDSIPEHFKSDFVFSNINGFINISLKEEKLLSLASNNLEIQQAEKKVVIDYGSPNIAKGMHVGHLRSTIIGSALVHMHKAKGHSVIGDNHIGDFGTPLGIVITQILNHPEIELTLNNIEQLYVKGSELYKQDDNFKSEVLKNTCLLQKNDEKIKAIWTNIVGITKADLLRDYEKMGIEFDQWNGESSFEPLIPPMIAELDEKKLISKSDGAVILNLADSQPLMLEKSGGGYLYHTTDLACIKSRMHYDLLLYVVDKRQSLHFNQVFQAAKLAGYLGHNQAEHISFGTINGVDGKPFKTRSGEVLKLKELISEVEEATLNKMSDSLSAEEKKEVLPIVAMGALKFAELKNSRTQDYIFNLENFVSLEGCTGPYVMYAAVRALSILKKNPSEVKMGTKIHSKSERNCWLALSQFSNNFEVALSKNEPHILCLYAYEVASKFNHFYAEVNISKETDLELKAHYLSLVTAVYHTLEKTLNCLGISVPKKM